MEGNIISQNMYYFSGAISTWLISCCVLDFAKFWHRHNTQAGLNMVTDGDQDCKTSVQVLGYDVPCIGQQPPAHNVSC